MTAAELWDRLRAGNLVEGDLPERGRVESPWYVRAMLGIAGWIGALFLLGFVGAALAFVMKDSSMALVAGAGCCLAAAIMFRKLASQDFAAQFALAISLAGQGLMVIGLADFMKPDAPALYFAIAGLETVLALLIPSFLHRVLASGGAAVALALGIVQLSLPGLAAPLLCAALAWLWLEPRRWARHGLLWRPVGYGLLLALLLIETFRLFGAEQLFGSRTEIKGWMALHGPLLGRGLTAAVLVALAFFLSLRAGHAAASGITFAAVGAAVLIGLVSLNAPGLGSALLILLLGFAAGNRILMALGVLSLLGFVSHFYYSLHMTLLAKSGLLAVTGLCLLAAHFILRRGAPAQTEPGHA